MNAYEGGHSLFRQSIGGGHEFFRHYKSESADLIPDADTFFHYCCKLVHGTVQKTMLQHVQSDIIHIFVCVEKGGYAIFLTLMGGGVMQFYHLGMGRSTFFFLLRGTVCHPPPPLKFMKSLNGVRCASSIMK